MKKIILLLILLVSINTQGHPDDSSKPVGRSPHAILVQVYTEKNRVKVMKERNKPIADIQGVERDVAMIATKMRLDFKDNFHYCPVYYFSETDIEKIKAGQLKGILMKDDSTSADAELKDMGDDYLVVLYGYPVYQSYRKDVAKTEDNPNDIHPYGRGLIIYNKYMEQVSYLYKLGYDSYLYRLKKENRKYI